MTDLKCPKCGNTWSWKGKGKRINCPKCHKQTTKFKEWLVGDIDDIHIEVNNENVTNVPETDTGILDNLDLSKSFSKKDTKYTKADKSVWDKIKTKLTERDNIIDAKKKSIKKKKLKIITREKFRDVILRVDGYLKRWEPTSFLALEKDEYYIIDDEYDLLLDLAPEILVYLETVKFIKHLFTVISLIKIYGSKISKKMNEENEQKPKPKPKLEQKTVKEQLKTMIQQNSSEPVNEEIVEQVLFEHYGEDEDETETVIE